MSEPLDPWLATALLGGFAAKRAGEAADATVAAVAAAPGAALSFVPSLPTLSLPSFALPEIGWLFGRAPSGLYIPAAPALIGRASAPLASGSGPSPGRIVPADLRSGASWADAIDADALVDFLRAQHPLKPAQHVAALTGEPVETVRKWLKRETRPGFRATLVLVCVYGLPLVDACCRRPPSWREEVRAGLDRAQLQGEMVRLRRRIDAVLAGSPGGVAA